MEFTEEIKKIAQRAENQAATMQTEEATKMALIVPFIAALGYDIYNPLEVTPEYIADVGTKKGEKIDYAIMRDGQPVIFIECKWCGVDLTKEHASQLFRYFATTTSTRVGILTNGLVYQFYADLVEKNKMDERPFFTFDIRNYDENTLKELRKYSKTAFDADTIISSASELKYTGEIKALLGTLLNEPDEDFVRYFAKHTYGGQFTSRVRAEFTPIVKKAFSQFLSERVNQRLNDALIKETDQDKPAPEPTENTQPDDYAQLPVEAEGFNIIRAICCRYVPAEQIFIYYNKGYCSLYCSAYPDGSRKEQICRFYFKAPNKYLGLFDKEKEERVKIKDTVEIYGFANRIAAVVEATLNKANFKQSKSNSSEEPTA